MRNKKNNKNTNVGLVIVLTSIVLSLILSVTNDATKSFLNEQGMDGIMTMVIMLFLMISMISSLLQKMVPSFGIKKGEPYGKFPHFGKGMDIEKVTEIIENCSFLPYETRLGDTLNNVTVSDDEKWLCILGGYLPFDLICGYNAIENVLLAIDGTKIKLPLKARLPHIRRDIEAFFKDRGIYYTSMPDKAEDSYYAVRNTYGLNIDRENFGKVRYLWEKRIINKSRDNLVKDGSGKPCKFEDIYAVCDPVFLTVLSDRDIEKLADNVRGRKNALSRFLIFEDYRSEFTVCNMVEVLEKLGHPDNAEGIDFLFKCLDDVDEAYFVPAVEVLKQYPAEILREKIEENVKLAYEQYDAIGLAGLMFFAKEIDYEIKYIADMQKPQEITDGGVAYLKQA